MSRYIGRYINLDRSAGRRLALENQLSRAGLSYQRFAAVDGYVNGGMSGEVGALTSHMRLLREHQDHGEYLHVLEDDAVLALRIESVIDWTIETGLIDRFDLLFTDIALPPLLHYYQFAKRLYDQCNVRRAADGSADSMKFEVIDYFAGMSSYIVNRDSVSRVADVLARELNTEDPLPVDLVIRNALDARDLRVGCLFPFMTSIRPGGDQVTLRTRDTTSDIAMDLIRHTFFVECDYEESQRLAETAIPETPCDPQHKLMQRVVGFMLTDAFKPG